MKAIAIAISVSALRMVEPENIAKALKVADQKEEMAGEKLRHWDKEVEMIANLKEEADKWDQQKVVKAQEDIF